MLRPILAIALAGAALVGGGALLVPDTVAAASDAPGAAAVAETVGVETVTDGDTFRTDSGDRVRVLVVDSCESDTAGGPRATAQARELLEGQQVSLVTEPGAPDTDRFGRLLRYVTLADGRDYGEIMVAEDHTSIFEGGDASPQRIARARALDTDGRNCDS